MQHSNFSSAMFINNMSNNNAHTPHSYSSSFSSLFVTKLPSLKEPTAPLDSSMLLSRRRHSLPITAMTTTRPSLPSQNSNNSLLYRNHLADLESGSDNNSSPLSTPALPDIHTPRMHNSNFSQGTITYHAPSVTKTIAQQLTSNPLTVPNIAVVFDSYTKRKKGFTSEQVLFYLNQSTTTVSELVMFLTHCLQTATGAPLYDLNVVSFFDPYTVLARDVILKDVESAFWEGQAKQRFEIKSQQKLQIKYSSECERPDFSSLKFFFSKKLRKRASATTNVLLCSHHYPIHQVYAQYTGEKAKYLFFCTNCGCMIKDMNINVQ